MAATDILHDCGTRKWTGETATLAMPILLRCAIDGRTITYAELDRALHETHGRKRMPILTVYGHPAGRIGDVCAALGDEFREPVPPLNAILVNKSGIPGHGADYYLRRAGRVRGNLGPAARRSLALATIDAAHAFEGWQAVAEPLELRVPPSTKPRDRPIPIPRGTGRPPTGPESQAHKDLKEKVRRTPAIFSTFGPFAKGAVGAPLLSGDRLDVLFVSRSGFHLAVEVKTAAASDSEHARRVFQAVKYRATLWAMLRAEALLPQADAVLFLGRKPCAAVRTLAARLRVRIFVDA